MIFTTSHGVVLAALAASASAKLNFNNWCNAQVTVMLSHNGGCDYGSNGLCGSAPWTIAPSQIVGFDWIVDGMGTSVKISKAGVGGILQFEYAVSDGIYWDLSDLDGDGPGLVGTPFGNDNVKVSPTGNGSGSGTCVKIRCKAGQTCLDSYQHPDDQNTRWCPTNTGDMWIDLCQPDSGFNSKRDLSTATSAHQHGARHLARHAQRSSN
ncbi:hypothetical protein G7046_g7942 [Stylonectria norvegica]|nr:hypothetical protein G7046_g7942 [Stylonectria norvegica]